jgi:hypothetical protein
MHWTQKSGLSLMLIAIVILLGVSGSGISVSPTLRLLAFGAMAWAFFPGLVLLIIGSALDKRRSWPHDQNGWH